MVDDYGSVSFRQTQRQIGGADQQLAPVNVERSLSFLSMGSSPSWQARFVDLGQWPHTGSPFD